MTAEALVMNKNGIAIAADSVVTVPTSAAPKIYNTINKLFRLSSKAPVAVMVYGSAEFGEMPWEVLIKHYRAQRGEQTFATLEEYASDFIGYLNQIEISDEVQMSMFQSMICAHFEELAITFKNLLRQQRDALKTGRATAEDLLDGFLANIANDLFELEDLPAFREVTEGEVIRRFRRQIYHSRRSAFVEHLAMDLSSKSLKRFWRLAYCYLVKAVDSPRASGVVVAGYGETQLLPSVRGYLVHDIYMSRLKYRLTTKRDVSGSNQAFIIPFAQTEMVYRFMQGVDKDYQGYILQTFRDFTAGITDYIVDTYVADDLKETAECDLNDIIEDKTTALRRVAADYRQENFVKPVIDAVKNLPKHELATLAEALVQLTSLRRKMSTDLETVGEPIDVVVVSKGDGFVWIKRKRYYDPALNPHLSSQLD